MKRIFCRFMCFLVACVFSVSVFVPSFIVSSRAVGPQDALIVSALVTFLSSAGLSLWHDELDASTALNTITEDMQTLWGYYTDEGSGPPWQTMLELGADDGVTVYEGDFLLNYDTAQTFQGFANFLASHYSMTPDNEYALLEGSGGDITYYTLPDGQRAGLSYYSNGIWSMPVGVTDSLTYGSYTYTVESAFSPVYAVAAYAIVNGGANGRGYVGFCSLSSFTLSRTNGNTTSSQTVSNVTLSNVSRPNLDNGGFSFYASSATIADSGITSPEYGVNYYNPTFGASLPNYIKEMEYVVLAGDEVGTDTALLCSVGKSVFDLVYDLIPPIYDPQTGEVEVPGQNLVLDIGALSTASADDLVNDVVDYVANGGLQVDIAMPQVIAGNLEMYPQPEFPELVVGENVFTFADLGAALTDRFPFCIPWDLRYFADSFRVPEKPVNFRIDIISDAMKAKYHITGDTSFRIDLTGPEWIVLREILAWALVISVIGELALLTRNFVNNLSNG